MPPLDGPGPIILSPAGFVVRVQDQAPVNGLGSYGGLAVTPTLGVGNYPLAGTGFHQLPLAPGKGTLDLQVVTGAAGSARSLGAVVESLNAPTRYIEILLDATNRPYARIMDLYGTVVALTAPAGPPIAAGVPLHIRFAWNSQSPINGAVYAYLAVNEAVANLWATQPLVAWVPFAPVGVLLGGGSAAAFNGTIRIAQVNDTSALALPPGFTLPTVPGAETLAASVSADSLVAADLTVV